MGKEQHCPWYRRAPGAQGLLPNTPFTWILGPSLGCEMGRCQGMHGLCHQEQCRGWNFMCTIQVALPWSQSHPKEVLSSGQDAPLERGARSRVWFRAGAPGSQPSLVRGSSISCEGMQEPLSLCVCAQICKEGNSWFSKDKILKLTAFKFPGSTWEMLC